MAVKRTAFVDALEARGATVLWTNDHTLAFCFHGAFFNSSRVHFIYGGLALCVSIGGSGAAAVEQLRDLCERALRLVDEVRTLKIPSGLVESVLERRAAAPLRPTPVQAWDDRDERASTESKQLAQRERFE